jgi:lipopolysaccharide/colanic/teichoic acid biosynthesis glycosyltransferase
VSIPDRVREHNAPAAGADWQARIAQAHLETENERLRQAVAFGYGRRDYVIRRLLAVADCVSVVFALLATVVISTRVTTQDHLLLGLATVPGWFTILTVYGLYNRDIKRISHSTVDDLPWIMHAMLVGCLLTWLYFRALPVPKLEFPDILTLAGIATAAIICLRSLTRRLATHVLGAERVLFVGEGQPTDVLVRKMSAHPEYGLEPIGIVPFPYRVGDRTANGHNGNGHNGDDHNGNGHANGVVNGNGKGHHVNGVVNGNGHVNGNGNRHNGNGNADGETVPIEPLVAGANGNNGNGNNGNGHHELQVDTHVTDRYDHSALDAVLVRYRPDRLVLCDAAAGEQELLALVHRCKEFSLKVSLLPQLFSAMGPSVEVDDVEGVTVLGINPPVLPRTSRYLKRSLDLLVSAGVLLLAAPLMMLIALAIKIESRGPVLFKQRRIGKGGRPLQVVKFRTMVVGAEQQTQMLMADSQHSGWLKLEDDPRVTRVGRMLRRLSLDEMPQLWNILRGEMSLVGPRPLIESEDRRVDGWARSRLELTPGLTGLWQVLGRTNIPFDEMVKLDYLYVTNWSLWTDIRLILRTFPAVLTRRGAN